MITQISPSARVTLDGSGNGQVSLGPPSGTRWALALATLAVAPVPPATTVVNQPQGLLYRGSASGPIELVDSTNLGAAASSSKVGGAPFFSGQQLWAVWNGGDPGAVATLQVYGQQGLRSDPFEPALIGEGFPSNPTSLTLGVGFPKVAIGLVPPAELTAYYTATFGETLVEAAIFYQTAAQYTWIGFVKRSPNQPAIVYGSRSATALIENYRTTLIGTGTNTEYAKDPATTLNQVSFNDHSTVRIIGATSLLEVQGATAQIDNGGLVNLVAGTSLVSRGFTAINPNSAAITVGGDNDVQVDGRSQPRGLVFRFSSTAVTVASVSSTTAVAILSGSATLKNGRAFRLKVKGFHTTTIAQTVLHRFHRNATTGTVIGDIGFESLTAANVALAEPFYGEAEVRNNSGSDITDTWIWDFVLQSGTTTVNLVTRNGSPAYFECWDIGAAADFPDAKQV